MKVGTDAVLLACYIPYQNANKILEIGCGSGVISLVMAQLCSAQIQAIDIHKSSVVQAKENFKISPWSNRLKASLVSFQDFALNGMEKFDHIISNPPFFQNSMKSPSDQRNLARHTDTLLFLEMIEASLLLLNDKGMLSVILPMVEGQGFEEIALQKGFSLHQKVLIYPKPERAPNRVVLSFGLFKKDCETKELIIRLQNNEYSENYKELTKDFYLAF